MNGKKLYKNVTNKKISGVCSGLADYFDFDVTVIRLLWACVTVFTGVVPGVVIYIIAALVMPENSDKNDGSINSDCKEL